MHMQRIDTKARPYITFHFRYRPRGTSSNQDVCALLHIQFACADILRAQGIIVDPEPSVVQYPPIAEASNPAHRRRSPSPCPASPDTGLKRLRGSSDAPEVSVKRLCLDAAPTPVSSPGITEDVKPRITKEEDDDLEVDVRAMRVRLVMCPLSLNTLLAGFLL